MRRTVRDLLERLPTPQGGRFVQAFVRGTLEVELYAPRGPDLQQPHTRDELYIVVAGAGTLLCGGERQPLAAGDFLHVPAGFEHRFEAFSPDFCTWVVFYGPEGGELPG